MKKTKIWATQTLLMREWINIINKQKHLCMQGGNTCYGTGYRKPGGGLGGKGKPHGKGDFKIDAIKEM